MRPQGRDRSIILFLAALALPLAAPAAPVSEAAPGGEPAIEQGGAISPNF